MQRFRDHLPALLALALAALLPGPAPLVAGLRFQPVSGALEGADTAALASDGTTLWAGTARGVWRLSGATWALDGLADRSVSGLAVAAGTVYAATGDAVFRRGADGQWLPEPLPGTPLRPSLLVSDGTTVWAGGSGVLRRSGGAWTALGAPGSGLVTAMGFHEGDLVVGLSAGSVSRLTATGWTSLAGGLPPSTPVRAVASVAGTLWAGTPLGLFLWNGTSWIQDSALGAHDVQAITAALGVTRLATADAGVFRQSGVTWLAESGSILPPSVRCFATMGSDLYAGTGGGPVYRSDAGAGWVRVGSGLNGSVVSSLAFSPRSVHCSLGDAGGLLVGARGAGLAYLPGPGAACPTLVPPYISPPPGCGDVTSVALAPAGDGASLFAATNCGVWKAFPNAGQFLVGIPSGTPLTALATARDGGVFAGTSNAGIYRVAAGNLVAETAGLPANSTVVALGATSGSLFASLIDGLYARQGDGTWDRDDAGLPGGYVVGAIGGTGVAWAGLTLGGVYRRDAAVWRADSAGMNGTAAPAIDVSRGKVFAAAGKAGVVMKLDGGWGRERAGLPAGADVRAVRNWSYDAAAGAGLSRESRLFAGTAGQGLFSASTQAAVRAVPIVLDVVGAGGSHYRTELTLGSRAPSPVLVTLTYRPAPGFGAETVPVKGVTLTLSPGQEARATDALAFLRGLGVSIPEATPSAPIAGSLGVTATPVSDPSSPGSATEDVYAIARTWTGDPQGGTYGLYYGGLTDLDAAEDEARVYGLRSASGVSRSNLALVHVATPDRGSDPIQLSVQVYSQSGAAAGAPLARTLAPGEWYQFNNVLAEAGLPDGSYGYAVVTRTAGVGPFIVYGVVNDMATSDGSYLPMYRPGGLSAARRLVVPVVLDVLGAAGSHYTTELTIANDGTIGTPVDLVYRPAPGFGSAPGVPIVTIPLAAHEQRTIPDVIAFLRQNGVNVPDPVTGGPQAGTLSVHFRYLDAIDFPSTVVLARTSTPNPDAAVGGSFGLFYPAVALGGGARSSARVPALAQNASVRSNLAVVHTGGGSQLPITLSVQLYDAVTGNAAGSRLSVTLQPGDWYQWSKVLETTGALSTTSAAYAVVTRTSGDDTFFAYGVVNDNVTSDGSYIAGIPAETY